MVDIDSSSSGDRKQLASRAENQPSVLSVRVGSVILCGIRSSTKQYDTILYEFSKKIFIVWTSSSETVPEVSMLSEKKLIPMERIIGDILALAMKKLIVIGHVTCRSATILIAAHVDVKRVAAPSGHSQQ